MVEFLYFSDKKGGKSSKDQSRHDSSDDEDNPQSGKKEALNFIDPWTFSKFHQNWLHFLDAIFSYVYVQSNN